MSGNGFSNGFGGEGQTVNSSTSELHQLQEALSVIHGPYSSNDARRTAYDYLEQVKKEDLAPQHGFTLASDPSQPPVIRHYALSLLEYAIRHKWAGYKDGESKTTLRDWVIELAQRISPDDPIFLRNKIAQLWVDISKRSWGDEPGEWKNMDELLLQMWGQPGVGVYKEFVLFVLETLSDDCFSSEDTIAILREGILSKACVDCFTPAATLAALFPTREINSLRCGDEGWITRIGLLLRECLSGNVKDDSNIRTVATKILAVYRSAVLWIHPQTVADGNCVEYMVQGLACQSVPIQLASVEALHSVYSRQSFLDAEFMSLVAPMLTPTCIQLLIELFQWSVVDPRDIDDEKYIFSKKLSEMIAHLGRHIDQKDALMPQLPSTDLPNLLNLFFSITASKSLMISIPILVIWSRLLRSENLGNSPALVPLQAALLAHCSSRLIRYESLPEDTEDESLMFLLEDIDTIPERHAFLGNYRRFCNDIIETIVRFKQAGALYYLLGKIENALPHLYDGSPPFSMETYTRHSIPILKVDSYFTSVEAALKGYMRWKSTHGSRPQQDEQAWVDIERNLQGWCERILEMNFEDPTIRQRVLQISVAFAISALQGNSGFALKVLEKILSIQVSEVPEHQAYSDGVKEMQSVCLQEIQRLATKMPDQLLEVYDQLEARVREIIQSGGADFKRQDAYETFLFSIVHRATKISPEVRLQKLREFLEPLKKQWESPELASALSSFPGFCERMGLTRIQAYLTTRRAHEIEEWNLYQLDAEPKEIQKDLEDRLRSIPLRTTKSFLHCSLHKIDKDTAEYQIARTLWRELLPSILPNLLKFIAHSHAFHNSENWTGLPPEMRSLVGRILTDRFWQAGISSGSKDDFYNRVSSTRGTMEGFASTVRGTARTVREASYAILWFMTKLGTDFYGFGELPGPLAMAFFNDAHCLSSHQFNAVLEIVRLLIDDCPPELRNHFLPPILAACIAQMDSKCESEWDRLAQKQAGAAASDNLTDEMKEESVLRNMTYTAVMLVSSAVDPNHSSGSDSKLSALSRILTAALKIGSDPQPEEPKTKSAKDASTYIPINTPSTPTPLTMRKFCISSRPIIIPLLLFMSHAVRWRDTRSCGIVLRIFRSIIPEFAIPPNPSDPSPLIPSDFANQIREFISADVLRACISSLNEPYFVDSQKDLAIVIASIMISYSPFTLTPKSILLSLHGIKERDVDKCINLLCEPSTQQRQHRALVLDLLRDIKGVRISEQGRISASVAQAKKERSKMQQEFLKTHPQEAKTEGRESPGLEGVAGMFEDAK